MDRRELKLMEKPTETVKPTLKELLLSDSDRFDLEIPARGDLIHRKTETAILFNEKQAEIYKNNDSVMFAKPFPRLKLWLPPSIPLGIIFLGYLAVKNGHQFNVHGDAVGVFILIVISSIVALVMAINNLPSAIQRLSTIPNQRTFVNLACTAYASMFCLICLFCVIYLGFEAITQ
jgi:hypothetical protein